MYDILYVRMRHFYVKLRDISMKECAAIAIYECTILMYEYDISV